MSLYTYDPDLWSHQNTADVVWYSDPDALAHFYTTIVEHETTTQGDLIETLPSLFDPDECPTQYLPYLANMIGLELDMTDREETWRSQIRSAVVWYKEKGKLDAFNLVLYTMGMQAEIYPLWISEEGDVDRYPHDASWKPHARIDISIQSYAEWRRYLPEKIQYVFQRLEEVRPIHVLIRGFFLGWDLFDPYPYELITDSYENTVHGIITDSWAEAYFGRCGIWRSGFPGILHDNTIPKRNHRYAHRNYGPTSASGVYRNGANYVWQEDVLAMLEEPPTSPNVGDRYIVNANLTEGVWAHQQNNITEWDGSAWAFFVVESNWAIWVKDGLSPEAWRWRHFHGSSWEEGGRLYEEDKEAPTSPFFRECYGVLRQYGTTGPVDELEIDLSTELSDPVERTIYRDGEIQLRDRTYRHDLFVWRDDLKLGPIFYYRDGSVRSRTGIIEYRREIPAGPFGQFQDSFTTPSDDLTIVPGTRLVFEFTDNYSQDSTWGVGYWDDIYTHWDGLSAPAYDGDLEVIIRNYDEYSLLDDWDEGSPWDLGGYWDSISGVVDSLVITQIPV